MVRPTVPTEGDADPAMATPAAPVDTVQQPSPDETFVLSAGAREQVQREALIDKIEPEEVLRNALSTHLWLKGILRKGARVTIKHADGRREILRLVP